MRFTRVFLIIGAVAAIATPVALGFGFDDSVFPPSGSVGTPYSFQFIARAGCPPYEFVLASGSLPAGLSMSSSGKVTGDANDRRAFLLLGRGARPRLWRPRPALL